jgi:DNA polymerase III epsilon subunit-like protein
VTRPLVFIDTETTGLDPQTHELVEVAWAVEGGPVNTLVLPHRFTNPDPKALAVNGYIERELYDPSGWATSDEMERLKADLTGCTLVGANPRFDAAFLATFHLLRSEPWHYRLLDIQAYGMAVLRLTEMPGLAELVRLLTERGFTVPESDHTAAADVTATRAVFWLLQAELGL